MVISENCTSVQFVKVTVFSLVDSTPAPAKVILVKLLPICAVPQKNSPKSPESIFTSKGAIALGLGLRV